MDCHSLGQMRGTAQNGTRSLGGLVVFFLLEKSVFESFATDNRDFSLKSVFEVHQ